MAKENKKQRSKLPPKIPHDNLGPTIKPPASEVWQMLDKKRSKRKARVNDSRHDKD